MCFRLKLLSMINENIARIGYELKLGPSEKDYCKNVLCTVLLHIYDHFPIENPLVITIPERSFRLFIIAYVEFQPLNV